MVCLSNRAEVASLWALSMCWTDSWDFWDEKSVLFMWGNCLWFPEHLRSVRAADKLEWEISLQCYWSSRMLAYLSVSVTFKEQCLMWIEYAGIMAIVSRLQSEEPVWSHRTVNSAADSTTTAVHSGNLGLMVGEVLNWEQISGASFSSTGGPKCLIANWALVVMKASLQIHYAQQTNKEL